MKTIAKKSALILSLLTSSSVAWAHPGHGAGSGLIHDFTNGLMHPIGGMDHLRSRPILHIRKPMSNTSVSHKNKP